MDNVEQDKENIATDKRNKEDEIREWGRKR